VFHLQQAGVECGYLSGGQEYEESRELMARLRADPPGARILFVTPEKVARSDALMRVFDALHERQLLARLPPGAPAQPAAVRPSGQGLCPAG
jgi:bloom syndrome protein